MDHQIYSRNFDTQVPTSVTEKKVTSTSLASLHKLVEEPRMRNLKMKMKNSRISQSAAKTPMKGKAESTQGVNKKMLESEGVA